MWIMLNNATLSIVAHRTMPGHLLVRSRSELDINLIFPEADVMEDVRADYRFRAVIPRATVGSTILAELMSIDYDNFKNSVKDDKRHDLYLDIWQVYWDFGWRTPNPVTDEVGRLCAAVFDGDEEEEVAGMFDYRDPI